MKTVNKTRALKILKSRKDQFRSLIRNGFEHKAKDCGTCETQGVCCTDAHFVNVRITRLESEALEAAIADLEPERIEKVVRRSKEIANSADGGAQGYVCPLFEIGVGCLVHDTSKPNPCISHACYEYKADLPPSRMLKKEEKAVSSLNSLVYGNRWDVRTIPEWITSMARLSEKK